MPVAPLSLRASANVFFGLACVTTLVLTSAGASRAETTDGGDLDLGSAVTYSVLAGSQVTNLGSSSLSGDLGVSPGTAITGFSVQPNGVGGATHRADAHSSLAQYDQLAAYGIAAGLTPTMVGVGDLTGRTLSPGIYKDGALSLSGELTLAGDSSAVWVFQSSSTLITGPGSNIVMSGGASVCNVFWQVGSSATIGERTGFVGTILAYQQIDVGAGSAVHGRLLAQAGGINLNLTTVILPDQCQNDGSGTDDQQSTTDPGDTGEATGSADSPFSLPSASVGTAYSRSVAVPGMTDARYTVTGGILPSGLDLDRRTGQITGVPTGSNAMSDSFQVTAVSPAASPVVLHYAIPGLESAEIEGSEGPGTPGTEAGGSGPTGSLPDGSAGAAAADADTGSGTTGSERSPARLPLATRGAPYLTSVALPEVTHGTYRVSRGSLPRGLELDASTGVISGSLSMDASTVGSPATGTATGGTPTNEAPTSGAPTTGHADGVPAGGRTVTFAVSVQSHRGTEIVTYYAIPIAPSAAIITTAGPPVELATTGVDSTLPAGAALTLLGAGLVLLMAIRLRPGRRQRV